MTELRRLRRERGFSQERLAGESGVSRPTIHRIELSQQSPRMGTVLKLARALKVNPEEVAPEHFGAEGERPPGFKLTDESYQRLYAYARAVARKRSWRRDSVDEARAEDLTGAGLEGLAEAARKFDPDKAKGHGFEWWAKYFITNRITDEMRRLDVSGRVSYLDDVLPVEFEGDIPVVPIEDDE